MILGLMFPVILLSHEFESDEWRRVLVVLESELVAGLEFDLFLIISSTLVAVL